MNQPTQIAHYRITGKIGEGGMGAVYRAIDTKLNRDVAIKVLPEAFARDVDRLARFTREAHVLAALNHPNIATIYGVEERALIMEFVDGAELKGPLPIETALLQARQIAEALEAAHEKGIVHRDLKPANVLITKAGVVKVLDFGLAKAAERAPSADPENSPTLTMGATVAGVIMGTAAYMSPEQAAGSDVDKRSDIWAFGVVLCEMLTGKRLFKGESISHTLASVLKDPIDLAAIPAPPAIRELIGRCLERDPKKRLRDIGEARLTIERVQKGAPEAKAKRSYAWPVAAALAAGLVAALVALWRVPQPSGDRPMIQLEFDAGPNETLNPAISPDGTRVVFVSRPATGISRLMLRRLDQSSTTVLAGTENAQFPFFSPDGRSVGFFADNKLKTLSLEGGAATALADAPDPAGGAWSDQGRIAAATNFSVDGLVHSIPAAGGSFTPLTNLERVSAHAGPRYLPGESGLLYTDYDWSTVNLAASVRVLLPGGKKSKLVLKEGRAARYLSSGHLVFFRNNKLYAQPFDFRSMDVSGEAIPMIEDIAEAGVLPQFDVSSSGALVYRYGKGEQTSVVRMDASGKSQPLLSTAGLHVEPRVSPDGTQAVVVENVAGKGVIRIVDLARGSSRPLTLDPRPQWLPVWTPDSRRVIYESAGKWLSVRADGGSEPAAFPFDGVGLNGFSHDGKFVAGLIRTSHATNDLWIAPVERDGEAIRFGKWILAAGGPGDRAYSAFSPDGRWLVYMSNESGRYQTYVISLTVDGRPAGGKWKISPDAGYVPVWPKSGGRIFFDTQGGHINAVRYAIKGDSFFAEPPQQWSPRRLGDFPDKKFDMTPDGNYAIAAVAVDPGAVETKVRVVLNFGDEIRRRFAATTR